MKVFYDFRKFENCSTAIVLSSIWHNGVLHRDTQLLKQCKLGLEEHCSNVALLLLVPIGACFELSGVFLNGTDLGSLVTHSGTSECVFIWQTCAYISHPVYEDLGPMSSSTWSCPAQPDLTTGTASLSCCSNSLAVSTVNNLGFTGQERGSMPL